MRIYPQFEGVDGYYGLRDAAFRIIVPEAVDIYDLWKDVARFVRSWRPMRVRTPDGQEAARRVLEEWERTSAQVR